MNIPAEKLSKIAQYAAKKIATKKVYENDYFRDLYNGSMSLEDFRRSQEQFYFAVCFFSRPMAALMARFPMPSQRLSILENIVEEHGSFSSAAYHETTFKQFLQLIGVETNNLENCQLSPEIRAFNSVLMNAAVFDEPEVGVACLGVIEYMFATISSIIGKGVVARDWCRETELKHYKLHEKIDIAHALDFFNIIEDRWEKPERQYYIQQGIEMGIYIFNRLYQDLNEIKFIDG